MKRIAYVMCAQPGSEADLREAHVSMPADELESLGFRGFETFIGSGYFVMVFDAEEDDFQNTMRRFFETPSVQGFLDRLRPHVSGLPQRGTGFTAGDDKHDGVALRRSATSTTVTTAELPLAASAYRWTASGSATQGARGNGSYTGTGRSSNAGSR